MEIIRGPALVVGLLVSLFAVVARGESPKPAPLPDGKPHKLGLHDQQFWIDDQPLQIVAGEMHIARILPEFWEDRIKKARAMGLNTVSVYLFWNQIEPTEGKFDWTGINDVRRFVKLCQANGLWVAVRPGPYVCAETEFGGYPAWLLKHPGLKVRANEPQFMEFNRRFITELGRQIADLQVNHGGPILMTQVENEYSKIDGYLSALVDMFRAAGFDGQLFTCDHSGPVWNIEQGIPGILRATNGLPNEMKLDLARKVGGDWPVYGSEVYTSWFSVWGADVGGPRSKHKSVEAQIKDTQWLLDRHLSWCFYMFDGGTNFGYSNGAQEWRPVQTTYDYDAPVDELGRVTPKYKALRELFTKELHVDPPAIPPDPNVIEIPPVQLSRQCALLDRLSAKSITSDDVLTMEDLDQSYGFVLYRKQFWTGIKGELNLGKALDYSIVMIDGQPVGRAFAGFGPQSFKMQLDHPQPCTLDILVYNLGRNSVGINQSISRKGLNENPTLDGKALQSWEIFSLPLHSPGELPQTTSRPGPGPAFYRGTFTLEHPGETYLDMRNWGFGVAWVNGHNLGRFWDVGACRCLYLPSAWEQPGENEIVVLELNDGSPKKPEVIGTTQMVVEPPVRFPVEQQRSAGSRPVQ
jgi:beta-galactosidase